MVLQCNALAAVSGALFSMERAVYPGRISGADFLVMAPGRYLINKWNGAKAFKPLKDIAAKQNK
jgi:hypothetical protein